MCCRDRSVLGLQSRYRCGRAPWSRTSCAPTARLCASWRRDGAPLLVASCISYSGSAELVPDYLALGLHPCRFRGGDVARRAAAAGGGAGRAQRAAAHRDRCPGPDARRPSSRAETGRPPYRPSALVQAALLEQTRRRYRASPPKMPIACSSCRVPSPLTPADNSSNAVAAGLSALRSQDANHEPLSALCQRSTGPGISAASAAALPSEPSDGEMPIAYRRFDRIGRMFGDAAMERIVFRSRSYRRPVGWAALPPSR